MAYIQEIKTAMSCRVFLPWKLVIFVCTLGVALCVQASGTAADAAAAVGSLNAASAGASLLVAGAALLASRRTRDQDKADSKNTKTVNGYVSTFRNFYRFCRESGRVSLVPAAVAKEKLVNPDIFNNLDHVAIEAEEGDIFSCFISWLGKNTDGRTASASRVSTGRSAIVHYLKTRDPPRKLKDSSEIMIEAVMDGHLRHIVVAKEKGEMRVILHIFCVCCWCHR